MEKKKTLNIGKDLQGGRRKVEKRKAKKRRRRREERKNEGRELGVG